MIGVGFVTLLVTIALFATLPMQFQPETDEPVSTVRIEMPPGTTLPQTRRVAAEASEILLADPDVDRVFQRIFTSAGYVHVIFKKDRSKKSFEIERDLNPKLARIADARVNFVTQNNAGGRPIGLFLGSSDPVLLQRPRPRWRRRWRPSPSSSRPASRATTSGPKSRSRPRFDLDLDLGPLVVALDERRDGSGMVSISCATWAEVFCKRTGWLFVGNKPIGRPPPLLVTKLTGAVGDPGELRVEVAFDLEALLGAVLLEDHVHSQPAEVEDALEDAINGGVGGPDFPMLPSSTRKVHGSCGRWVAVSNTKRQARYPLISFRLRTASAGLANKAMVTGKVTKPTPIALTRWSRY